MGYFEVIGEERTLDHQSGGKVTRLKTDAPNTLSGYAYIMRSTDGRIMGYNATAIANFSRNQGSLFESPGSASPTLLNCEDTLDQLEFQLRRRDVSAGYNIDDAAAGKFSLILTFPTKHYHFQGRPNYTILETGYPTGSPWTVQDANAPEPMGWTIFDRNEQRLDSSPGPAGPT
jgi:hypothetical protein